MPSLASYPGMAVVSLHIHFLFVGGTVVGAILFTVWALRTLKPHPLKMLSFWLLAVGILGTLLSAPFSMQGMHGKGAVWMAKDGETVRLMERLMNNKDGNTVPMPMMGR